MSRVSFCQVSLVGSIACTTRVATESPRAKPSDPNSVRALAGTLMETVTVSDPAFTETSGLELPNAVWLLAHIRAASGVIAWLATTRAVSRETCHTCACRMKATVPSTARMMSEKKTGNHNENSRVAFPSSDRANLREGIQHGGQTIHITHKRRPQRAG